MSQGTFRIGLEAMYKALTGEELERVVYGKPEAATYQYADEVIMNWMEIIHNDEKLPKNIYMVGDNPASDIIGKPIRMKPVYARMNNTDSVANRRQQLWMEHLSRPHWCLPGRRQRREQPGQLRRVQERPRGRQDGSQEGARPGLQV